MIENLGWGEVPTRDAQMTMEGLEPGRYLAADLFERYQEVVKSRGRTPSTSKRHFGSALIRAGYRPCQISTNREGYRKNYRGWIVPEPTQDTVSEMPS